MLNFFACLHSGVLSSTFLALRTDLASFEWFGCVFRSPVLDLLAVFGFLLGAQLFEMFQRTQSCAAVLQNYKHSKQYALTGLFKNLKRFECSDQETD